MQTDSEVPRSGKARHGKARDRSTVVALAVLAPAATAFLAIAVNVVRKGRMVALDLGVVDALHAAATPALTHFMLLVSDLQGVIGVSVMSVLLAWCLHRLRRHDWLLGLVLAVPGGMLFNSLLKLIFHRPRPAFDNPIVTLQTWSFPSGHVAGATLFYGVLAAWLVMRTDSVVIRVPVVIGAMSLIALVAASRMYLGAHYPSDVAAGFVGAIGWLALCLLVTRQLVQRGTSVPQDCQ